MNRDGIRGLVYAARGPATDGDLRWFSAVRTIRGGREVSVRTVGSHGASWDEAANTAHAAAALMRLATLADPA